MPFFLTDSFSGVSGTALEARSSDSGSAWSKVSSGSAGASAVLSASGTVRPTVNGGSQSTIYLAGIAPGSANYTVAGTVALKSAVSNDQVGVCARMTSADSGYIFVSIVNNQSILGRRDAGGFSVLAQSPLSVMADGDVVGIAVIGTTVIGFINGVAACQATDATYQAAGLAGIEFYAGAAPSDTTGAHLTSLVAETVGPILPLCVGSIGDSLTQGYGASVPVRSGFNQMLLKLAASLPGYTVSGVNHGVGSATTADWLPASTTQESGGSVNGTGPVATNLYNNAKAAFLASGVNFLSLMLGTNDSRTDRAVSAATYQSNLATLIAQLRTDFPMALLMLHFPPYVVPGSAGIFDASSVAHLGGDYRAALTSLADGIRVFTGEQGAFAYFQGNPAQLIDGIHANDSAYSSLGQMWAGAVASRVISAKSTSARGGFFF